MKDFAELLKAIASLLWPIVALVLIFVFKPQIKGLLTRVKSGKVLGQEFQLSEALQELNVAANVGYSEVVPRRQPALPSPSGSSAVVDDSESFEHEVLDVASRSPKIALLSLSAEIERVLWELLGTLGLLEKRGYVPVRQAFDLLGRRVPSEVRASVGLFMKVRNQIVHGGEAREGDVVSAIDSGITILRTLKAIPYQVHAVRHTSVPLYSDAEGQQRRHDVSGVIVESKDLVRGTSVIRVFPTTKTHFKPGVIVCWEWDLTHVWGPTWYRNPTNDQIEKGWDESGEFVGPPINDVE